MKPLTVAELVEALLALEQPNAAVRVVGSVVCHGEHSGRYYEDVPARLNVTNVRSTLNQVILEAEE